MAFYSRKPLRLKNYDYSQNNAYFLTICTQNKKHILGTVTEGKMILNCFGMQVKNRIINIEKIHKVCIENYVIMPNHIHILLLIDNLGTTRGSFPTVSKIMQELKSITTLDYVNGVKSDIYEPFEAKIWQKSFYDHIIRDTNDYQRIWKYIETNPLKWELDCYY